MKKHSKRLFTILGICLFLCAGCSSNQADITIENSRLESIDLENLSKRIENKEEFLVMVSQNSTDSILMERTLAAYFRERDILPVYECKLNDQGDKVEDTSNAYAKFQDIVPYFSGTTPQCFYYKDGEMKETVTGALSEIAWQNFMIKCGVISGDIIEEPQETYQITEDGFEKVDLKQAADLLRNKEDAYVYYARDDRYNEAYSKTLSTIVKEQKIKIYLLCEKDIVIPSEEEKRIEVEESISLMNQSMDMNFSPSLYHLKDGAVESVLKDNVTREEILTWLSQHPLNK